MVSDRKWQCRGPVHPQGPGSGGRRAARWCSSPVHKIKQLIKANHAVVSSMSSYISWCRQISLEFCLFFIWILGSFFQKQIHLKPVRYYFIKKVLVLPWAVSNIYRSIWIRHWATINCSCVGTRQKKNKPLIIIDPPCAYYFTNCSFDQFDLLNESMFITHKLPETYRFRT